MAKARGGPTKVRTRLAPRNRVHVMLGYPHPGVVAHDFMASVLNSILRADIKLTIIGGHSGPLLTQSRNDLLQVLLDEPSYTHLLFADTDMRWDPDAIGRLVAHDVPIVSGLCMGLQQRDFKTFVACLKQQEDGSLGRPVKEGFENSGLQEVFGTGMAFTLIKREVIEKLGVDKQKLWPFAEIVWDGTPEPIVLGEDITFCLRARELGFDTYVDTDLRIGHVKRFLI